MNRFITIPPSFQHSLFFQETTIEVLDEQSFDSLLGEVPFLYDLLHKLQSEENKKSKKPWEQQEIYVPKLFHYWQEAKADIGEYFKKRNRTLALKPMVVSLGHFISALYWTNGSPVQSLHELKKEIKQLPLKPMNAEDRIMFLLEQPNQYHSYVQLGELYQELTKIYYKMLLIKQKDGSY